MAVLAVRDSARLIRQLDETHTGGNIRNAKRMSDRMHDAQTRDRAFAVRGDPRSGHEELSGKHVGFPFLMDAERRARVGVDDGFDRKLVAQEKVRDLVSKGESQTPELNDLIRDSNDRAVAMPEDARARSIELGVAQFDPAATQDRKRIDLGRLVHAVLPEHLAGEPSGALKGTSQNRHGATPCPW
jgi:hypothetical protein